MQKGGIRLIIKAYSETHYLETLNNLIQRLSITDSQRKELTDEYMRINAGDIGEKFIMETLEKLQLPYDFYIFHNLSLHIESKIQIDILIITKYYIIILEVKNIKGAIEFSQNPKQLIRTLPNGEIHVFNSPEPQLEEYTYQIKRFFLNYGIDIPVYGAIVFPFTSSFIRHPAEKTIILRKNELKPFLRNMPTRKEYLNNKEIEFFCNYFLKEHLEFTPYPLIEKYKIQRESVKNGVICPSCGTLGMKRFAFYWFCQNCGHKSTLAHENAIYDYLKIINNTITNRECRKFLEVNNIDQVNKMLRKMPLNKIGNYRNTKYTL